MADLTSAPASASGVNFADLSKLAVPTLPALTEPMPKAGGFWSSNPLFSYINDTYISIAEHRKSLGLINPGTVEGLNKEVSRDVFLNNYFFTGLRADFNKTFAMDPAFQTAHTLSIGSPVLLPYTFTVLYASSNMFVQGNIDSDYSFMGRANLNWDKSNISKVTLQFAHGQPAFCQFEQDYQGSDFSVNLKALNPSFLYGPFTGVAQASLLQSLTPKLAVGLETAFSRQPGSPAPDATVSYFARYNAGSWIGTAQIQGQGSLLASFWRKVTDKVEAGIETQIGLEAKPIMDPLRGGLVGFEPEVKAETTIGAKYEYRQSVFRGQLDSAGKVRVFMEKRILPNAAILFSGEIDHAKSESRLGVGLQFETAGNEEILMMQQGLIDANGNPIPGAPQL